MGRIITRVFDDRINPAPNEQDYNDPSNYDAGGVWLSEMTTMGTLHKYMKDNDIPETAFIRYAGCGSHMIEFFWPDPEDEEDGRL